MACHAMHYETFARADGFTCRRESGLFCRVQERRGFGRAVRLDSWQCGFEGRRENPGEAVFLINDGHGLARVGRGDRIECGAEELRRISGEDFVAITLQEEPGDLG